MASLDTFWQTNNLISTILYPLSRLFCLTVQIRRSAYQSGVFKTHTLSAPVIIVGNISVGGTGKTPLVIWLSQYLQQQSLKPGVLTRGYFGKSKQWPQLIRPDSDPDQVGDEAVLLARRCDCPVVAGPNRVASGQLLISRYSCNVLLSDDGLQHYTLQRDLEIAVIDGQRRLGNGLCLPAGPLRELPSRLDTCDLVIINSSVAILAPYEYGMDLSCEYAVDLKDPYQKRLLSSFQDQKIIAVAGIGNPQRFFSMLRTQGLNIAQELSFPDHHKFTTQDFAKLQGRTVLMTEKDAVKCERLHNTIGFWYVPIMTILEPNAVDKLARLSVKISAL